MMKAFPKRYQSSDALQDQWNIFKYDVKAYGQSFQRCILRGGQHLVEVSQNKDFLKKAAWKTAFLSITIPDQLTLEGAGTTNFQSLCIFHMFPEHFGAKLSD